MLCTVAVTRLTGKLAADKLEWTHIGPSPWLTSCIILYVEEVHTMSLYIYLFIYIVKSLAAAGLLLPIVKLQPSDHVVHRIHSLPYVHALKRLRPVPAAWAGGRIARRALTRSPAVEILNPHRLNKYKKTIPG